MCRRNPDHAEYWKFSWAGGSPSTCKGIYSNWVENRASLAFSGPISRYYVVLELCGMDFSIPVQIEYAMFGRDQGVGAGRFEQEGHPQRAKMSWPLPATESEELLEWPLTAPVNVVASI